MASSFFAIAAVVRKRQRAGIDFAARMSGDLECLRHRVLDAAALQGGTQHVVEGFGADHAGILRRRADHQHEFAARLQRVGLLRESGFARGLLTAALPQAAADLALLEDAITPTAGVPVKTLAYCFCGIE